jgi:hypothetical protein
MYKLAIWILLPSMLLNGVWMVCSTPDTGNPPMSAEEKADCIRICAALEAEFGRICIIWPNGSKPSISVIDYGAAILPDEIVVKPMVTNEEVPADFSASHGDPTLSNLTPPPKA